MEQNKPQTEQEISQQAADTQKACHKSRKAA